MGLVLINNQCHQSARCATHSRKIKHQFRPFYCGVDIPIEISRPIRAGILFDVNKSKLYDLVLELLDLHDGKDKFPLEIQSIRAQSYTGIISSFRTVELVDNCFWGDGVFHRGRWVPYQWYTAKKQMKTKEYTGISRTVIYPKGKIFFCRAVIVNLFVDRTHIINYRHVE